MSERYLTMEDQGKKNPKEQSPFDLLRESISDSSKQKSDIASPQKTGDEKVREINNNTIDTFLKLVSDSEEKRLNRQKPLQNCILIFVGMQLLFFNGIMVALVVRLFSTSNVEVIKSTLDFLKYYVGAVLVEMIGMIVFITRSTFTTLSREIISGIFRKNDTPNKKK